jgi:hypothetical protein
MEVRRFGVGVSAKLCEIYGHKLTLAVTGQGPPSNELGLGSVDWRQVESAYVLSILSSYLILTG